MSFRAFVEQLMAEHIVLINAGDAVSACAHYSEDCLVISPRRPPLRGRQAVTDFHAKIIAGGMRLKEITILRCEESGDLGSVVMAYATEQESGTIIDIFKRQADGSWQCDVESVAAEKTS